MLTIHASSRDYKILCFVEMGNVGATTDVGGNVGLVEHLDWCVQMREMVNAVLSMSMETVQTAAAESSSA